MTSTPHDDERLPAVPEPPGGADDQEQIARWTSEGGGLGPDD